MSNLYCIAPKELDLKSNDWRLVHNGVAYFLWKICTKNL